MSDTSSLSFTVPGLIRGKQRAGRVRLPGGGVRSFNPKQTASNEKLIRDYASVQMRGRSPFTDPMSLSICIYKVKPPSWSAKRRAAAHFVTGKPDCDNIAKLVADALNTIVWHDDAQIAHLHVLRRYGNVEQTKIEIRPMRVP